MTEAPKTYKILVVDDDRGHNKLVESVLGSKGYEIVVADEAPNGLELAMKARPDLIVLDVMMPIINGFNICRLMKSEEACKNIPIILLTSRITEEDRRIGHEVGADAYLLKPLNTGEFLDTVGKLLKIA